MSGGETSGDGSGGGGTMGSLGGPTGPNPADKAKQDALYEDREPKKIIRIITVSAYMVSVSFVGIVLSVYYIFLWHPPNPRLMHAQAISAHSEALHAPDDVGLVGAAARLIDSPPSDIHHHTLSLLPTDTDAVDNDQSLKIRREIVRNVNAMMRANFERSRELSQQQQEEERIAEAMLLPTANVVALSTSNDNATDNSTSSSTAIPSQELTSASAVTEESSTMTTGTTLPPSRKPKGPAKKQHQTPFALKHLQEPIKADGSPRRRPVRPTTRSGLTAAPGTEVPTSDKPTYQGQLPTTTPATQQVSVDGSSPSPLKSLYKTLTTPHDNGDYTSSSTDVPAMPSISSDQFQAAPRDYVDATGVTMVQPDLLDD